MYDSYSDVYRNTIFYQLPFTSQVWLLNYVMFKEVSVSKSGYVKTVDYAVF